jgi:hypothetical protein
MSQIQGAAEVALFIRRQMESIRTAAKQVDRPARASATGNARQSSGADRGAAAAPREDVAAVAFRRIRYIDPADPDRKRKAFRIFIESVLLFELGEELMNDPLFYQLVETVEGKMSADPALARAMDEASDMLVAMAQPG